MISVGDFKIDSRERAAINSVLDAGRISEGRKTREFEEAWAEYVGTRYSVALSSGTSALIAGLLALKRIYGIKDGENVITSPLTYISTVNAVSLAGLNPVFVDVDRRDFSIKPSQARDFLKEHSARVILPVHLMGYPCDMNAFAEIARKHDLLLFEDSAQAHGSRYNGKMTGSMSDLSEFSFYIAHNIQAGEMGALNTNSREISSLVRKLKSNGRLCSCPTCTRAQGKCPHLTLEGDEDLDPRFTHDIIAYNFKTMDFQAALALSQIQIADKIVKARQENVLYLNEGLKHHENVLALPPYSDNVSYLAYPITIKDTTIISRKKLRSELERRGIETRPLFGCIPTQQPAYAHLKHTYEGKLPNAEYLGRNALYIGCHQYLKKKDLDDMVSAFGEILK